MFVAFYRERPILAWTLTGVVGFFIVWWLLGRLGGSGTTGTAGVSNAQYGPSDASVTAGASIQVAQLQADAAAKAADQANALQLAGLAVEEELSKLGYQTQEQSNTQMFNLQHDANTQAFTLQKQQNNQTYDLGLKTIAAQTQSESVNAALQTHIADLQAAAAQQSGVLALAQTAIVGGLSANSKTIFTTTLPQIIQKLPSIPVSGGGGS